MCSPGYRRRGLPRCGGPSAHLLGFGDTKVGVDVQGVLPVLLCLALLTAGVTDGGQAAVGPGLLVVVPAPTSQGQRGRVTGAGLIGAPGGEECFPGTIERLGMAAAVADFLVESQRLLMVSGGLVMVPLLVADLSEPAESAALFPRVAGLAGEGERSGEAVAGLGVLADGEQRFPSVVDCRDLELAVTELLVQSQ